MAAHVCFFICFQRGSWAACQHLLSSQQLSLLYLQETEALRVQNEKSHLLRAMDCFTEGVMLLNVTTDDFKIIFLNDAWARITGAARHLQGAGSSTRVP